MSNKTHTSIAVAFVDKNLCKCTDGRGMCVVAASWAAVCIYTAVHL